MQVRIPKFFDHHNHFSLYLTLSMCPSLADVFDRRTALAMLASLPDDRPNLVTGWHSGRYELTPDDLQGLPPVAVVNWCLHGYLMNRAAAGMAVGAGFPVVPASARQAEILMPNVLTYFGGFHVPDESIRAAFIASMKASGVWGMEDMLYVPGRGPVSQASDDFPVKSWVMPQTWEARGTDGVPGFMGFKLFADGAVGSRTAAISAGFQGGGCPVLTHPDHEMVERIAWCLTNADAVAIHAIGDLAIQQVLDALDAVTRMPGMPSDAGRRVRLEHAQFITGRQAVRAHEMGLTLSMQPNFNEDSETYADRLDAATLASNNPFRMLIDQVGFVPGQDLIFGSDGMPQGMAAAVQNAFFPPIPGQYISPDELAAGYGADPGMGFLTLEIDPSTRTVVARGE